MQEAQELEFLFPWILVIGIWLKKKKREKQSNTHIRVSLLFKDKITYYLGS